MGRRRITVTSIVCVLLVASVTVHAQNNGIADRVAALEQQVAVLQQQLAALENSLQQQLTRLANLESADAALSLRLAAVESADQRFTRDVHCESGDRISDALFAAEGYSNRAIINVYGKCVEAVRISRRNTFLQGASADATIEAPTAGISALTVLDADRVFASNLTIQGGNNTVTIIGGAYLYLNAVTVRAGGIGVFASQGSVNITDSTIKENKVTGVSGWAGSRMVVNRSTVSDNGGAGIVASNGATVMLDQGTVVRSNQTGVNGGGGAAIALRQTTIEDNHGDGVRIAGGSVVAFESPALGVGPVVRNNGGSGLFVADVSVAMAVGATGPAAITGNGNYGVFCREDSVTEPQARFALLGAISGNAPGGVECAAMKK